VRSVGIPGTARITVWRASAFHANKREHVILEAGRIGPGRRLVAVLGDFTRGAIFLVVPPPKDASAVAASGPPLRNGYSRHQHKNNDRIRELFHRLSSRKITLSLRFGKTLPGFQIPALRMLLAGSIRPDVMERIQCVMT